MGLLFLAAICRYEYTGRYTQADPIGLNGGWNRFGYANANALGFVDQEGLKTVIVINDNTPFIGTHVGLYIDTSRKNKPKNDKILYDPSGSYSCGCKDKRGSGDFFEGAAADLTKYIKYQMGDGTVNVYVFNTTEKQEDLIRERIYNAQTAGSIDCAISVSSALNNIGPFKGLGLHRTPRSLHKSVIRIHQRKK